LLPLPPSLERVIGAAAAGHHHLLLLGPRGTGKSHALEWLIALQPETSAGTRVRHALLEELRAPTQDAGAGRSFRMGLPVRRISAHARPSALLGAVSAAGVRPGEFTLAHGGVLVADELPEWPRDSRESLREPLERGRITLTRAQGAVELPARFVLAANGNLCPCGGWPREIPLPAAAAGNKKGKASNRCHCKEGARTAYLSRLSGPILDRFDLVAMVASGEAPPAGSDSAATARRLEELRARVSQAAMKSGGRWGAPAGLLGAKDLEGLLTAHPRWREQLDALPFSSLRSRHKALRVALSLAAWDGAGEPGPAHFAEAACYRAERFGLQPQ
jgi:magnesium chelatase family protein